MDEADDLLQRALIDAEASAAVALQGAIFALVKMVVQRSGAKAWRYFFGIWPGEKRPDPA